MKFEVTASGTGKFLWLAVVGTILFGALLFIPTILSSSDRSGAGILIFFMISLAEQKLYLILIPSAIFGLGMYHSAKTGERLTVSCLKWFATALASYIVIFFFAISAAVH